MKFRTLLCVSVAGLAALAAAPLAAGAAPIASASAPFASDRISVEVRGEGPDVVLVPGLASSREVFARTAAELSTRQRVHLVQVSGFAGQPAGANGEGPVLAPLVDELARYIRARGLKQPAVIGHSMGGAAALMLAERHPELPGRLMIVDALPFFPLTMGAAMTPETVRPQADLARDTIAAMSPEMFAAAQKVGMLRLVKDPAARERWGAASAASNPSVVARAMHELMTTDLRGEIGKVRAPLTVLYAWDAAYGRPVSVADTMYRDAYAGVPTAKLIRVDGSFHFIMDDQPERFAAAVEAFLR
jgi:pimeloyl-ACP methyl ester carboxylesterase